MAGQGLRRGRCHCPSGLRRAGHGRGIDPQQQQGHARPFRRQGKAAAGRQVQFAHRPPAFDDDRTQRRAAQGIDSRPQQGYRIGQQADNRACRNAAQFRPTIGLDHASATLRPQPQHRLIRIGQAGSHGHGKPRRTAHIPPFGGIDLMHPPTRQPSVQDTIHRPHAKLPVGLRDHLRIGRRQDWSKSHMFLLCSNLGEINPPLRRFLLGFWALEHRAKEWEPVFAKSDATTRI